MVTTRSETVALEPADCATMVEVRRGIDVIDRQLVTLLAARQRFVEAAARIKPERRLVRDEARIADVMAKVLASAAEEGLSEAIAAPVWRKVIACSIDHELRLWDARHHVLRGP